MNSVTTSFPIPALLRLTRLCPYDRAAPRNSSKPAASRVLSPRGEIGLSMTRTVAIIGALAAGALVGLQPPANASMAQQVGALGAALISMAISIFIAAVLLVAFGDPGRLSGLSHFRPEWLIGGVGGAAVVTVGLITVRPLGAGAVVALLVAAQLVISVLADQLGWFGTHHALTPGRVSGVVIVMLGTALI